MCAQVGNVGGRTEGGRYDVVLLLFGVLRGKNSKLLGIFLGEQLAIVYAGDPVLLYGDIRESPG